jgi:large subunit ribosomal protein L4
MKVPVYNQAGEQVREEELPPQALAPTVRTKLLKQVVLSYENNRRTGTACAKRRGEVAGSGRKMYRQKGTGMARMGSRRNPIRVGGGVVHGPRPRSYRDGIPRGMRRGALGDALRGKLDDGEVLLLEALPLVEPKTRVMAELLGRLGCLGDCLLVTPGYDALALKSVRNLPGVAVREARDLNAYDLLAHGRVLFVGAALTQLMERSRGAR